MTNSLTESLIEGNGKEVSRSDSKDTRGTEGSPLGWVGAELRRQLWLAAPMVCVSLLLFSLNMASVMFVGHLGNLSLASASMATSLCSVTGFSLLAGMSSALETLCGQAYGAKQYRLLGVYLQRAIIVLNVCSIPLAFVWMNIHIVLRAMGQDPEIAEQAGLYASWLIPSLFATACTQPLVKFLQAQSAVFPMACCVSLTLCLHIPICWLLVYKLEVGYRGAAIANSVSTWLNVIFLVGYIKLSPTCKQTWEGFTSEAFHDMPAFFSLAIPSAAMICLEYWSFEMMVLMSGLLPNPQLEMSAFAICLNTIALLYMIPYGLSAAVSTRVSNELGAGKAFAAKRAVIVAASLALAEGIIMSTVTYSVRRIWPLAFTSDLEVVDYVAKTIPNLYFLLILDAFQGVLSGVTRGCGVQDLVAYSNLGAYYGVGVPLSIVLAFVYHLNGPGLWYGLLAALVVQTTCLLLICFCASWERQAQNALDRVYGDQLPTENIAILSKDDVESPLIWPDVIHE